MDLTNGIVIGEVIDLEDPENLGRVRVKFPHLDNQTSDWARIATPMAGPDRGVFFRPEVGDEVLIAFLQRDPRWSFVVGALWSKVDRPPDDDGKAKENNWRFIKSRSGHKIVLNDDNQSKQEKIEILSSAGHRIALDDSSGKEKIEIVDRKGTNKITIDSVKDSITIESGMQLKIKANTVEIEGTSSVAIKGGAVSLEATAALQVQGKPVKIN